MDTALFHACCRAILQHAPSDYAKAYAEVGLCLTSKEAIKTQILYMLCNLQTWRGDQAKSVKDTLRAIAKCKQC